MQRYDALLCIYTHLCLHLVSGLDSSVTLVSSQQRPCGFDSSSGIFIDAFPLRCWHLPWYTDMVWYGLTGFPMQLSTSLTWMGSS